MTSIIRFDIICIYFAEFSDGVFVCGVAKMLYPKEKDSDQRQDTNKTTTNLIVNYLPQSMTQDEVRSLFASFGVVASCKLIKDKLSGQSLGYAFVTYEKRDEADTAMRTLNGMHLQNKTIKVSLARPSSDAIKGANLYVCGLPPATSQADLERLFRPFGTIVSSKILANEQQQQQADASECAVGFVRFDTRAQAEAAIAALNGKTAFNGSAAEPLIVKFANTPAASVKSVLGLPLAPPALDPLTTTLLTPSILPPNLTPAFSLAHQNDHIRGGQYKPCRPATNASYR